MQARQDNHRTESALYWSAVSLMVCEGLPLDEAAVRLGVNSDELRELFSRRQNDPSDGPSLERLRALT
jgi:hypothetical protein